MKKLIALAKVACKPPHVVFHSEKNVVLWTVDLLTGRVEKKVDVRIFDCGFHVFSFSNLHDMLKVWFIAPGFKTNLFLYIAYSL